MVPYFSILELKFIEIFRSGAKEIHRKLTMRKVSRTLETISEGGAFDSD
jgi:hypothetical protein